MVVHRSAVADEVLSIPIRSSACTHSRDHAWMRAGFLIPLHTTDELRAAGRSRESIASAVRVGRLHRVRRGVFAEVSEWASLETESRVIANARALSLVAGRPPVFSHRTAAAIHSLPLLGVVDRLEVLSDGSRPGDNPGVSRRRAGPGDPEIVEIHGLRCTSLDWTVGEVARWCSPAAAVVVLDAALRGLQAGDPMRAYDEEQASSDRGRWLDIASVRPHRFRVAQRAIEFADGRADRPGESVSRAYLRDLGFRPPRLQVRVPAPNGNDYFVDFALDDCHAFGEFDGVGKYLDRSINGDRDPALVVLDEKRREDWIRGTTDRRFGRWGWEHLPSALHLGRRLAAFSIHP